MLTLSKPTVLECYLDDSTPPLPAMRLRWDSHATAEGRWYLPGHLTLTGAAPERFGLTIARRDTDVYAVRVLWNEMCLSWAGLSRVQLLTSALAPILRALGQDIWQLLNQPIDSVMAHPAKVA